jgi:hypothetical protein
MECTLPLPATYISSCDTSSPAFFSIQTYPSSKGKDHTMTCLSGHTGVTSYSFATRHYKLSCEHHSSAALPPGKLRYPLYKRVGGPRGRSGDTESLAPLGFDARNVPAATLPVVKNFVHMNVSSNNQAILSGSNKRFGLVCTVHRALERKHKAESVQSRWPSYLRCRSAAARLLV